MSRYANSLIQTLVLDESAPPHRYECNPFGSHIMLRSKRITKATGGGWINIRPVKWFDDDAINQAVVRMYQRVAKDVGNNLPHTAALSYLRKTPEFLGLDPATRRVQIICKPEVAENLSEAWAFLSPTVYAVDYMGTYPKRAKVYFLLPSPEDLGTSPVEGDEHGMFVRESRRVVAVRF